MIVAALFAMVGMLQGDAVPPSFPQTPRIAGVRAGYSIEPETVRVGDPATLKVRVTAPAGTRIVFPGAVDSTSGVEPLDPVVISESVKDGVLESVASYRILAWEVGLPVISLGAIRVELNGVVQELRLGDPRVFVMSILPVDSTLRVPKPSRDVMFLSPKNWPMWLLIIAGFTVAVVVGVWLQRRTARPPPPIAPYVQAQRAFSRLTALDLVGAGEPARHVGASADILREFLAARGTAAAMGLTTAELLRVLEDDESIPIRRVADMLGAADDIKFAASDVDPATAERLSVAASRIVDDVYKLDVKRARRR